MGLAYLANSLFTKASHGEMVTLKGGLRARARLMSRRKSRALILGSPLDWYTTVLELIDLRSFSNLWYWMAVAVLWSTASHWILGVPFDLIQRAGRSGGQAEIDLEDLIRINLNRIFYVVENSGHWLVGFVTTFHVMLIILGFWYDVEFMQALFFLAFPMTIIGVLSVWTGGRIRRDGATGDTLRKYLTQHRLITQMTGVISIFITGIYGMAQNMLVVGW